MMINHLVHRSLGRSSTSKQFHISESPESSAGPNLKDVECRIEQANQRYL